MHTTRCPTCKAEWPVPEHYVGKSWRCPGCRTGFLVQRVLVDGKEVAVDSLEGGGRRAPVVRAPTLPSTAAVRAQTVVVAGVIIALGAQSVPALALDSAPLIGVLGGSAIVAVMGLWRGCPCAVTGLTELVFAAAGGWFLTHDEAAAEVARLAPAAAGLGLMALGGLVHALLAWRSRE